MALRDMIDTARNDGRDVPLVVEELLLSLESRIAALEPNKAPVLKKQSEPPTPRDDGAPGGAAHEGDPAI